MCQQCPVSAILKASATTTDSKSSYSALLSVLLAYRHARELQRERQSAGRIATIARVGDDLAARVLRLHTLQSATRPKQPRGGLTQLAQREIAELRALLPPQLSLNGLSLGESDDAQGRGQQLARRARA